ncbi:MAG: hypothetical protein LUC90_05305 [Lachnospiraceae bacterium]|nr:hypothetical protein [Lachnospiraceae bacterium]
MAYTAEQSISYSTVSVTKTVGDSAFTNELTQTLVYGELTYESSDTSVATVDSNGIVTIMGAGTAVITATAPGSDSYTEAVASYTLTVNAVAAAEDSDDTDSSGDSDSSAETDSIVETDSSISEETFDDTSASAVSAAGAETGDDMNLTLWLTLLLAGAAALTAVFAVRRKKG